MRWIQARWREKSQRWEWLPCRRLDGKLVWGGSYPTQEEACEAAKNMPADHARSEKLGDLTFEGACIRANKQLIADGGSEHTKTGYESRFGRWYDILERTALLSEITAEDVEFFKLERRQKHGAGNGTIRKDLVVMQRVFDIAGLTGDSNPVRGVKRPQPVEPDRPFLTMKQITEIIGKIRKSEKPAAEWHATVIAFLTLTGARAYEIERLRRSDVEETDDGGCCVVLHGSKGKRVRRVFIAKGSAPIAWHFVKDAADTAPLDPTSIATICKRWKKDLKLKHFCGRVLRRTFATEMARHESIHYVQSFLGHAQLTTTQKYLGIDQQRARGAAEQLHLSLGESDQSEPHAPDQTPDDDSATQGTQATQSS